VGSLAATGARHRVVKPGSPRDLDVVQAVQGVAGGQHGGVLGGLDDHLRPVVGGGEQGAADGEVVGLRFRAGEHDPGRVGADQRGHLASGGGECLRGGGGVAVGAGRVPEPGVEVGLHRRDHGSTGVVAL
jgi:hypothetical protein